MPTPEHFTPMLYLAGLAAASGEKADQIVGGYAYATMSMSSYSLGLGSAA